MADGGAGRGDFPWSSFLKGMLWMTLWMLGVVVIGVHWGILK